MASTALQAPVISQAELEYFHEAHFGHVGVQHFSTNFLPAHGSQHIEQVHPFHQDEIYEDEEQDDDGLGYYEDGVKRTLTDEQIAMFRHSELEALRRSQESAGFKPTTSSPRATRKISPHATEALEPGEVRLEDNFESETVKAGGKKRKRKRTKTRVEPEKPDLRKRTWDVVDTGLASLDYGDEAQESTATPQLAQRRHISYDD